MKIPITLLGVLAAAAAAQAVDFTTLDGKVLLGYQGWFNCPGDGDPNRGWRSWAHDTPSAKTLTVDMYPDLSELNPSDLCPHPGFTVRGRQAFLYSAMNSNVVDRHFLCEGLLPRRRAHPDIRRRIAELWTGAVVHDVLARDKINRDGNGRGKRVELLGVGAGRIVRRPV